MTLLDGTHKTITSLGPHPITVNDLTGAEQARMRLDARCAALDAASRLWAGPRSAPMSGDVVSTAERFEKWLLRDVDDLPNPPGVSTLDQR